MARRTFALLAASFVLAIAALAAPCASAAGSDVASITAISQAQAAVIGVNGSSVVSMKPDEALVTLGADTASATVKGAQEANSKAMNAVLKALSDLGVAKEQIKTDSFTVNPDYQYDTKTSKNKLVGYRAVNRITVTLDGADLSKVGVVVDAALGAGATTVDGVTYGLKDSDAAKLEALKLAAKDARARAQVLAEALGLRISGVAKVSDSDAGYTPVYAAMDKLMDVRAGGAPTPIQSGDVQVTARVYVEFQAQ